MIGDRAQFLGTLAKEIDHIKLMVMTVVIGIVSIVRMMLTTVVMVMMVMVVVVCGTARMDNWMMLLLFDCSS